MGKATSFMVAQALCGGLTSCRVGRWASGQHFMQTKEWLAHAAFWFRNTHPTSCAGLTLQLAYIPFSEAQRTIHVSWITWFVLPHNFFFPPHNFLFHPLLFLLLYLHLPTLMLTLFGILANLKYFPFYEIVLVPVQTLYSISPDFI